MNPSGLLEQITNPRLRALFAVWEAARGTAAIPRRAAIDPAALGELLACAYLVEHHRQENRFRYRIAGSEIERALGLSLRGRYLDEIIPDEDRDRVLKRWLAVIHKPSMAYQVGRLVDSQQHAVTGARLLLPLLCDEEPRVRYVLGVTDYRRGLPPEGAISGMKTVEEQLFPIRM